MKFKHSLAVDLMSEYVKLGFTRSFNAAFSGLFVHGGSVESSCSLQISWAFIVFHCFQGIEY